MYTIEAFVTLVFQDTAEAISLVPHERMQSQIHELNFDVHTSVFQDNVARVTEYMAAAPVIEHIAPPPAVFVFTHCRGDVFSPTGTSAITFTGTHLRANWRPDYARNHRGLCSSTCDRAPTATLDDPAPLVDYVSSSPAAAHAAPTRVTQHVVSPHTTTEISKRTVEQVVDGVEDADADFLRHEQVLHSHQSNIDHCGHLLKTKKEDLEQYEKEVTLLARAPRATFRERHEWQSV